MANIMNMVNGKQIEDASVIANAVRYDMEQIRSEEEKARARANIGIEGSGGGGGALMVNANKDGGFTVLDKTWQEIYDAAQTGPVIIKGDQSSGGITEMAFSLVTGTSIYDGDYYVLGTGANNSTTMYTAVSTDGYPRKDNIG